MVLVPILRKLGQARHLLQFRRLLLRFPDFSRDLLHPLAVIDAYPFGIDLMQRRMIFNSRVANRLRDRGIVNFAVAVSAISHEIDYHITAEGVAILSCESRDAQHGIRIFGVDVKDWHWQTLRQVGRIAG